MPSKGQAYREQFRLFLKSDRAILMFSIGIAFVLWFITRMTETYEDKFSVQLEYQLPLGKTLLNHPPSQLDVNLKSTGWNLLFQQNSAIPTVAFPLSASEKQAISNNFIKAQISEVLGSNYEVSSIEIDKLEILLDSGGIKTIPLHPTVTTKIKNGFIKSDTLQYEPKFVQIAGPQKWLDSIYAYPTQAIQLVQEQGDIRQNISLLEPVNPLLRLLTPEIKLSQKVEKYIEEELTLPIEIVGLETISLKNIESFPKTCKVVYRSPISLYKQRTPKAFSAQVRFTESEIQKGTNNTAVIEIVRKPEFSEIIDIQPQAIEYYRIIND